MNDPLDIFRGAENHLNPAHRPRLTLTTDKENTMTEHAEQETQP